MSPGDSPPQPRRDVRTYTPRFRTSALTRERLHTLLPAYAAGPLPLDVVARFGRSGPVVLEIGSGHGAAAIGYALAQPGHNVLACEVHLPGVARMLAAADAAGVTNLRVHPSDAMALLAGGLPEKSLHRVHLLFPDPWPKVKHAKRRFLQRHTLDRLAAMLECGGVLLVATDHPRYAAHARDQFTGHGGFAVREVTRPAWKGVDGFEAKGLAAGRTITYLEATARG